MKYRFDVVKEEYYPSLLRYRYLLKESNSRTDGCNRIEIFEYIESWDLECKIFEDEATVPPGYSIGFQWLYIDEEDNVVGMVNFRPKALQHPSLKLYGGHIGYNVRPDKQGQGIGTSMLKDFLKIVKKQYAKTYDIDKVLITCNDSNEGSRKIILNNGGEFEKKIYCPYENGYLERYWIKI